MNFVLIKKYEEFNETIKEISYPLVLEQHISKNKTISDRKLIDSEEIKDYKLQILEINQLYNSFFNHIKNTAQNIVLMMNGVSHSVLSLYNFINQGITNYREMLNQLNINNLHQNMLNIKNSFLKIKIDIEQIKVNLEIRINTLHDLINNNKNDFIDFQKKYDSVYNKLEEKWNEIIKKIQIKD